MYRFASMLLLLTCATAAWADRDLLSASLGLWLKNTAAPELVEVLGNHPKFKGQQVRFVTLENSKPAMQSNRLNDAVQQYLTHQVLRAGRNNVAWQSDRPPCATVTRQAPYLVGVEVSRAGRYKHRVSLAIIDTEEAVWVSGVSLSWQGKLLEAERAALGQPVSNAASGTLLNPIPIDDRKRLVDAIQVQLKCSLPAGLDGTVHVKSASQPQLQLVMRQFAQALTVQPTITPTATPAHANWQLHADILPAGFEAQELALSLAPNDNPQATQRIAGVFITGALLDGTQGDKTAQHEPPQHGQAGDPSAGGLLGDLRYAKPGSRCKTRARGSCVEVTFDLFDDAHLLVFRTSDAQVRPTTCTTRKSLRKPGEHKYHIKLPGLTPDTPAGIYVLASRQRSAMRRIERHLQRAPGACGRKAQGSSERWLAELLDLVEAQGNSLEWRALHLVRAHTGFAAI